MKVFVAGATGVLGRAAVSAFVQLGHTVTGVARSKQKADVLRSLGAQPVACDLFDAGATKTAVVGHDVVCNLATKIPGGARYFLRRGWRENDRLHSEASSLLVDAAIAAGSARYIQHSVAFQYADGGASWLDEDAPIDPPPHGVAILDAENHARRFAASGGTGVALRFGMFYGAEAPNSRDLLRIARMGFVPLPGRGDAYVSSVHVSDLGSAVVAATSVQSGEYNVVDDDPVTRETFGGVLVSALGRTRLRPQPEIMRRLGGKSLQLVARSQRVSNGRFRSASGWTPSVASIREGWPTAVAELIAKVER